MSEEANAPVEQAVDSEVENLKAEVEAMRKKNAELLNETKKAKAKANAAPDVDVQALLDFKAKAEQAELEQKGKYGEAKQALEQQYREKSSSDKQRIEDLESKVRELELISPASQALAEVVHDPSLVLQNFLPKDKIDIQEGKPVVVDGYERIPVADWAKTKLKEQAPYLLKQQTPQGGGAPAGRTTSASVPSGTKNPFEAETFNITEQMRLYRTDKDLYDRLQSAAKR
tara:strand:+ start:185 stop:871 length:687 start_codon:yes stop_codon:yes gene_type:complete